MNEGKGFAGDTRNDYSQIDAILPKEAEGYFKSIDAKHFDPETAIGSRFTETGSLRELLEKAASQRGNMDGDDRQSFIEMGVSPDALMPMCRYLKVEAKGEVGIEKASDLPAGTKVKIVKTKPNAPCSLVIERDTLPSTDFGTIIIGPNEKNKPEDPEPTTKEMIWTVHPGLPVRPPEVDFWPEGSEISIEDVMEKLGRDFYLNVKKIEKPA